MHKVVLVLGGMFIGGGLIMMTQERRIQKIHKMYEELWAEFVEKTYTEAFVEGKAFGVGEYRRQVVRNAAFN